MNGAWLPLWILGGPFFGLLFLSSLYQGGTSSAIRGTAEFPGSGRGRRARSATLDTISRLSGPVDPGAIAMLSGRKDPGAISTLSRWKSPGAIARLSGWKSPGAISRLSGPQDPGAIRALSASRPVGSIGRLSAGFYVSEMFGLPLLTRSQAPTEPDASLLIPDGHDTRRPPQRI